MLVGPAVPGGRPGAAIVAQPERRLNAPGAPGARDPVWSGQSSGMACPARGGRSVRRIDEPVGCQRGRGVGPSLRARAVLLERVEKCLRRHRVLRDRTRDVARHAEAIHPLRELAHDDLLAVTRVHMQRTKVVVIGPQQRALAEHLQPARRRPTHHLVPHAHQRRQRPIGEPERHARDVVDAGVPEESGDIGAHPSRIAEDPPQHVEVVDGVLDERPTTGLRHVRAPVGAVHPLHREVLVVAQHDRERAPVTRDPTASTAARKTGAWRNTRPT